jgi:hypothetical protein
MIQTVESPASSAQLHLYDFIFQYISSLLTHKELCLHGRAWAQVVAELLLRHFLIIITSSEYQSLHGCFVIWRLIFDFVGLKAFVIVYMLLIHGSNLACCFRCFRYLWASRLLLISFFIVYLLLSFLCHFEKLHFSKKTFRLCYSCRISSFVHNQII